MLSPSPAGLERSRGGRHWWWLSCERWDTARRRRFRYSQHPGGRTAQPEPGWSAEHTRPDVEQRPRDTASHGRSPGRFSFELRSSSLKIANGRAPGERGASAARPDPSGRSPSAMTMMVSVVMMPVMAMQPRPGIEVQRHARCVAVVRPMAPAIPRGPMAMPVAAIVDALNGARLDIRGGRGPRTGGRSRGRAGEDEGCEGGRGAHTELGKAHDVLPFSLLA